MIGYCLEVIEEMAGCNLNEMMIGLFSVGVDSCRVNFKFVIFRYFPTQQPHASSTNANSYALHSYNLGSESN